MRPKHGKQHVDGNGVDARNACTPIKPGSCILLPKRSIVGSPCCGCDWNVFEFYKPRTIKMNNVKAVSIVHGLFNNLHQVEKTGVCYGCVKYD